METDLQDENFLDRSNISITTQTFVPKPVDDIEINQNYLKQFPDNITERSFQDSVDEKDDQDDDDENNIEESGRILSVEEKKKTDGRIILCVKKKSSFMVSAILDKEECDRDEFLAKNKQLSNMLTMNEKEGESYNKKHINEELESEVTAAEYDNTNNSNSIAAALCSDQNDIVENKPEYEGNTEQSSHKQYIGNAHKAVKCLYTQIIDKTSSNQNESTDTNDDVETVFPTMFGSFTNSKDNTYDSQLSYFESKINEIKKRKMKEVNQSSGIIEEKRVRKRKQERPQPISCKQRQVEVDFLNENPTRKSKRKQIVTKRHFQYDTDSESQDSNEIKQTPLCSKLCKTDSRKRTLFKKRTIERISNFEETSQSEDSNIPCTTNRYRRYFLKQLRNAEAAKSRDSNTGQTNVQHDTNYNSGDYDSDDDYLFDGKRIKIIELEASLDSNKCKVCNKEFSDIGMLMAHYICHSSIEKDKVNSMVNQHTTCTADVTSNAAKTVESTESGNKPIKITESNNTYFCHLCSQKFTDIMTLQEHVLEHSANLRAQQQGHFECNFCQKTFATQGSLYLHKKIHTGDNPYSCVECHKQFRDKTRLTTHMRVHTGEKPYCCEYCQKTFSQKGNLKLHQQKIHFGLKRGKYRCKQCGVYFSEKKNFAEHLQKSHAGNDCQLNGGNWGKKEEKKDGNVEFVSENSNSVLDSKAGNLSTNEDAKAFTKNETNELTRFYDNNGQEADVSANGVTVSDLTRADENSNTSVGETSLVIEEEAVKLASEDFSGAFVSGSTDKPEAASITDTSKAAKFTCPICNFPYQTATSFNRHFQTHGASMLPFRPVGVGQGFSMIAQSGSEFPSGVKKVYRCEECSLDFVSFPEFQCHLKSHKDNNSKVMCNICQKQMSSSNLLDHMRIHTGEKPYGCIHCGKLFRRSHHLQTHLRTHTGDRPYVCVDCGKTFARGDHLQNHRRTHTGEKPYKCEICEKSYSQSHHLLRHKRTHTGEKPYNCELCDKRFSRDHHLKKHMETHRVVIYTQATDTTSQSNRQDNPKIELPSMPMSTRSTDRIAQLLSSTWYNNIASGVMADIVQKHLSTEKELGKTDNLLSAEKELDKTDNLLSAEKELDKRDTLLSAEKELGKTDNLLSAEKELGKTDKGTGKMTDIKNHLLVQRTPQSDGTPQAAEDKTTIVDDTPATQEPLKDTYADLMKSFEVYKETYSKMSKDNNDRSKTINEVMQKFSGSVDISVDDLVGKDQNQVGNKDLSKTDASSDISSQGSDENASIAFC